MLLNLAAYLPAKSQSALQIFETFNKVCSAYQYVPLQLEVDISATSNVITSNKDSLHVKGIFNLGRKGSFFKMNDQEEVVNDSVLVITDHKAKKILLSFQTTPTADQLLATFKQTFLSDSVAQSMTDVYNVSSTEDEHEATIFLTSKDTLTNSNKSREEIVARYDPSRMQPSEITLTKRELFPIERSVYDSLWRQKTYQPYLLRDSSDGYKLIKETRLVSKFISIEHQLNPQVNTFNNYIIAGQKEYLPTASYKNYEVTVLGKL